MRLTFLGTGTSTGVPFLGCNCEVCCSSDPRDKRLRVSALLDFEDGKRILIDCGPDFRQQMLQQSFQPIDAVLLTHDHYDHIGGLDDLRPFCKTSPIDIFADRNTLETVRRRFDYCFREDNITFVPQFRLHEIAPNQPFQIGQLKINPLNVNHGRSNILGFRIGKLAYLTDMKSFTDEDLSHLNDVDCLVVDALQWKKQHPTHQTIEEALHFAALVRPKRTYFVHMSHNAGLHADSIGSLPYCVCFAYDGLQIDIPEDGFEP